MSLERRERMKISIDVNFFSVDAFGGLWSLHVMNKDFERLSPFAVVCFI